MSDPIDDLLERSAPTLVDRASARDAALAARGRYQRAKEKLRAALRVEAPLA
ncbi:hypothetical protein [Microbacterium sp.]|uniref:hypothetical protein n=1 Tax=Microbacterium sp. TaxID=51671 RepID=UPI0028A8CA4D|nr:hypothetical protein [Microbacterium sp.]